MKKPTLARNKQNFIHSVKGRVLFIFRQKMDGPSPLEMDMKTAYYRAHILLTSRIMYIP